MSFDPEKYKLEESNAALRILPGTTLESLTFFSDRLELSFHRAVITVRTDLYFRRSAGKTIFQENPEWLDCLAGCVGHEVTKAEQDSDTDLVLSFDDGAWLMLSLRQKDRTGEPAVHLVFERSW